MHWKINFELLMPDFWLPFSSATKFGWQFSFLTTKLTNICQKRLLAWAQFTPTLVALKSITFASLRNFSKEWLSKPLQKFHITSISRYFNLCYNRECWTYKILLTHSASMTLNVMANIWCHPHRYGHELGKQVFQLLQCLVTSVHF